MANKKTVALTTEEYKNIINSIRNGFVYEDKVFRPNNRVATILVLQANLGLRVGDILKLRFKDILKDGSRFRLDIVEEKTQKKREFTVPLEIYNYIKMYYLECGLKPTARLFDISERAVQKQLKIVCDHLELQGISTHSFRKYFATEIYKNNNYNIALIKKLLQHSTVTVSQNYIGVSTAEVEEALAKHICLL